MKKDEELSLTTFCQSMKGEMYWEIKSGAQDASRQYTHLLSWLLQVPFLFQVEILIKVRRFFGRREKMEGERGDGSHITSALSESDVWLWAVLGEGQGPPGVIRFISRWFPGRISAVGSCVTADLDDTEGLSLRWTKWGVWILEL